MFVETGRPSEITPGVLGASLLGRERHSSSPRGSLVRYDTRDGISYGDGGERLEGEGEGLPESTRVAGGPLSGVSVSPGNRLVVPGRSVWVRSTIHRRHAPATPSGTWKETPVHTGPSEAETVCTTLIESIQSGDFSTHI